MWEDINSLYHKVSIRARGRTGGRPPDSATPCKRGGHRFHGVCDATLPRDEGWHFLQVGCALERAEMTARILDVQYHQLVGARDSRREARQSSVDGGAEIGRRVRDLPAAVSFQIEPESVAEMLILHPQHPRSMRFNVQTRARRAARHQRRRGGKLRQ